MEGYPDSAWRRAMKVQEVMLKAMGGEITWLQAADILGVSARTVRRNRRRYEERGVDGLLDGRRGRPSPKGAPYADVERVLKLYRQAYRGFNAKHFHEKLMEEHGIGYGYTWVKQLLQEAGYVKRSKGRGGHRQRRERRRLMGQMVHLDGSEHEWLALRPGEKQVLILAVDDATGWNLAADIVEGETTAGCLRVMREVVEEHGIPAQLYTDRGSVYWKTPRGGCPVDKVHLTQFGRAMEELGVEMIAGYSPQARGRGERWFGTWQGRLVNELRVAGIAEAAGAKRYIREVFLPEMNRKFTVQAVEEGSAFVGAGGADLERIFALRHARQAASDNTVRVNGLVLQIERSRFRTSFAQCEVEVYEHLNGTYTIDWKGRRIGRYDSRGRNLSTNPPSVPRRGKRQRSLPGGVEGGPDERKGLSAKAKSENGKGSLAAPLLPYKRRSSSPTPRREQDKRSGPGKSKATACRVES